MKNLHQEVSIQCSRLTTQAYSTSFSYAIRCLAKDLRDPVYSIYGFVRFADEIVDTFHGFDKELLLEKFREDTYHAIDNGISLNPILHSFQKAVRDYGIDRYCIETFLESMRMDLHQSEYTLKEYEEYIVGSAEVVGLMCLRVFLRGNSEEYERLKPYAMKLGSAFQKINFLRDLSADFKTLGRTYFPQVDLTAFNAKVKKEIEDDIEKDFQLGYDGVKMLPKKARFGVFVAYIYYYRLFEKIKMQPPWDIMSRRIRINNGDKFALLCSSYVRHSFNLL